MFALVTHKSQLLKKALIIWEDSSVLFAIVIIFGSDKIKK